ncbi:hypothetical protein DFQ28_010791 [Apophysomyces sp. BC1034]|nr:hypothetical protein DFQ30_001199 [Apophysomyces sp. BC1015]KAG0181345.1 hypothetical protein DFQ29_008615 [Apophysomyces sp. BC1021]KAG0191852.1 hypothetical protein DFQ28_010791 [Apophysomyces sp. BC1034]
MRFQTINRHIDSSLESIDQDTLDKMLLADIIEYCQERGLSTEGSKADLIQDLIYWKTNTRPVPAPSTPTLYTAVDSFPESTDMNHLNSREFSALFLDGNATGLDIPYEALVLGTKLGSGGFKDCYAGTYVGEPVAIGELRLTQFNQVDLAEIKHEINVLKQLRHENVIRFIGVCTHPQHLCIITELCDKGDLFDVIRKYKRPSFAQQVNRAMLNAI